jgi:pimeloyl-ACP methyl ester carboxylesterase
MVDEEDTSTPPLAAYALAEALVTTRIQVVPHSSHFNNLDAPIVTNELLLGFLTRYYEKVWLILAS